MSVFKSTLRPFVGPHPVVIIITLVVAGFMVFLALDPRFHPPFFLYAAVAAFLLGLNQWSRIWRAKSLKQREKASGEIFLNIESPGKQKSNKA